MPKEIVTVYPILVNDIKLASPLPILLQSLHQRRFTSILSYDMHKLDYSGVPITYQKTRDL